MVLAGCGGAPAKTIVAAAATVAPTKTPVPSNTPLPTSTSTPVPTATATVTRTATPNHTATAAVQQTATQSAVNEVVNSDLTKYGIDPSLGHVAWTMDEPVVLDGGGYGQGYYQSIKELGVLKDFVVQTKVTWDTSGALAGCAYIFRAPEDWSLEVGDFYELTTIRVQYAPVWLIAYYKDGHYQYSIPGGAGVHSKNLVDTKMSENIVTMDAHGDQFTIYINGVKERTVQNNKVDEGRLAFEVIQNSGSSYCKFSYGWVWVYDK
jgi:hypothetical protein